MPFRLRRRGVEAKLVAGNDTAASTLDPKLVDVIRNAHRWLDALTSGAAISIDAIAEQESIPASEISRILPLAFLAPEITKSILVGDQPIDLTAEQLKRMGKLPANWKDQRRLLRMST